MNKTIDDIDHKEAQNITSIIKIKDIFRLPAKKKKWTKIIGWSLVILFILVLILCFSKWLKVWASSGSAFMGDEAFAATLLGYIVIVSSLWWNLDGRYGRRWTYLSESINSALMTQDYYTRELFKNYIATDILKLKFEGHSSFKVFFEWQIKLALCHYEEAKRPNVLSSEKDIKEVLAVRRDFLYNKLYSNHQQLEDESE